MVGLFIEELVVLFFFIESNRECWVLVAKDGHYSQYFQSFANLLTFSLIPTFLRPFLRHSRNCLSKGQLSGGLIA